MNDHTTVTVTEKTNRKITDADVEAIAEALKKKVIDEFYQDLGKGFWSWFKKMFFTAVLGIAAYGAIKTGRL